MTNDHDILDLNNKLLFLYFSHTQAYPNQPISTRDTMNRLQRLHWTHRTKKSDPETELDTDQTQG